MSSSNFNNLNNLKFLEENSSETQKLWKKLLDFLKNDNGEYNENINEAGNDTLFDTIESLSDLPEEFFQEIYQNMVSSQQPLQNIPINYDIDYLQFWNDYPWNESVAKLFLKYYYFFDNNGIEGREDGFLIEDSLGNIDQNYIRGSIPVSNRTTMKSLDIKNADAGNSFLTEEDMYNYINYLTDYTITISYQNNEGTKYFLAEPIVINISRKDILEKKILIYEKFFNISDCSRMSEGGEAAEFSLNPEGSVDGWIGRDIIGGPLGDEWHEGFFEPLIKAGLLEEKIVGQLIKLDQNSYYRGNVKKNFLILKNVHSPWVIPWYNMDGETYKKVRSYDLKKSVIKMGDNQDLGNYYLDFSHKHGSQSDKYSWTRLLMPQYKRSVQIEDLNRNFWVIGQVIAAITAYLLDPDGAYATMIGGLLNEIMQLWENILFLWGEAAFLKQLAPDITAEIVYIDTTDYTRNDFLYYDNFDSTIENEYSIEENINGNIIHSLKRNTALEEIIVEKLRKYQKNKYNDQSCILIPLIRLNNYSKNYYNRLICLGYYKYQKDYYNYRQEDTPPFQANEKNGVAYINPSELGKEKDGRTIFDSDSSWYQESFIPFCKKIGNEDAYAFDFSIDYDENGYYDFAPYISGIFEYENEAGYGGINLFKYGKITRTPNLEKVYAIIFPRINAAPIKRKGGIGLNLQIEVYDLAKYFLTSGALINNNTEQMGKYSIFIGDFSLANIILDHYGQINISQDIRKSQIPENPPKELTSNNKEFGYYLGDLISNYCNSQKIVYNIKVFDNVMLRPTLYNDIAEYKRNYGRIIDQLPEEQIQIIKNDMEEDRVSLINYLKNAYRYWELDYSFDEFWKWKDFQEDDTKGAFESIPFVIAYDMNRMPISTTRKEVKEAYNNPQLVWDKQKAWQEDSLSLLYPNYEGGDMTPTSILFANGMRTFNFYPNEGDSEMGVRIITTDGLVHNSYPNAVLNSVSLGAATKMPIPGEQDQFIYYPIHTDPTGADLSSSQTGRTYNANFEHSVSWLWRNPVIINKDYAPEYICSENGEWINPSSELYYSYAQRYRSYPLILNTINGETDSFSYGIVPSRYGTNVIQYSVLKKNDETDELKTDNWLISRVQNDIIFNLKYAYINETGFHKIDAALGKENDIDIITEEYDAYIYRKYINFKLQEFAGEGKQINQFIINNNISIDSLYPVNDMISQYDLHLETLLFGWLYVIDNNNNQKKLIFNYNTPLNYSDWEKEEKDIIRKMRSLRYANSIGKDLLIDFIKIYAQKITNCPISIEDIENCKYIAGHFNGINYGSINLGAESRQERYWYEDRIMDRNIFDSIIEQQKFLIKTDSKWKDDVKKILLNFSNKWYPNIDMIRNPEMKDCIAVLEQYMFPLETENNNFSINFGGDIIIKDSILFTSSIVIASKIWIFGPEIIPGEPLYARRGIYRYSLTQEGYDTPIIPDENLGKWPHRPTNIHSNSDTNWKDDYNMTGHDVDELRQNYTIYYKVGNIDYDFEKYKTHLGKNADKACLFPESKGENDDLDFYQIIDIGRDEVI